jgi:hypothetical protein
MLDLQAYGWLILEGDRAPASSGKSGDRSP